MLRVPCSMILSIVIPAYNEEAAIAEAIDRIGRYFKARGFDFEIIIVDDGSSDRTRAVVEGKVAEWPTARLLANEMNRGKGFSVKRGALAATGEWILFLDADLSTQPEEFEKLEAAMRDHDIVIGSRALRSSRITRHQPFLRELGGKFFNKIVRWYMGLPFHDTQCGFKCFNRRTRVLFEKQTNEGWVFDVELLFLAQKMGFRVAEVGVVWTNDPTTTVPAHHIGAFLRDLRRIKKHWGKMVVTR